MKKFFALLCAVAILACAAAALAAPATKPSNAQAVNQGMFWWSGLRERLKSEMPDSSKYEGMSENERRDTIESDFKALLEKKIAGGELTREQAEKVLERFNKEQPHMNR